MKQVFQIEWAGGTLTAVLISALLRDYFNSLRYPYQNIVVHEIKNNTEEEPCS